MDLIKLFKHSLKNPLSFVNLMVIFVTLFLITILALTLFTLISFFGSKLAPKTACNDTSTEKFSGTVDNKSEAIYPLNFKGNDKCFLDAFATWQNSNNAITFWLYDPSGKVITQEPESKQTHNFIYVTSPLPNGSWRLVLKTTSPDKINYQGELSIH